jgi:2-keto-4-pentenoate hydratase/2-oxohepta-3-ene-1,7-dioic acid hydratase in catechol pathway
LKFVTYKRNDETRLGAIIHDHVIDLEQATKTFQSEMVKVPPLPAQFPREMLALLGVGDKIWQELAVTMQWAETFPEKVKSFSYALGETHLAPPLDNPSKIVCIGLNYHDHCREQGLEVPHHPLLFAKFPSTIIGPDEDITWSSHNTEQVDYEAELAVIIGRKGRNIPLEETMHYIAGYTIVNDVSARDLQLADGQWVRGKSLDTFCPMGPYLVTADEVTDPQQLQIRCWVNGELRQNSNTAEMIFKIPELITFISRTCTLMPGDIISTGTPHGVGVFRNPPIFLQTGDVVEIEIENLGRLRNTVRSRNEDNRQL